jgi:hypothetical protein
MAPEQPVRLALSRVEAQRNELRTERQVVERRGDRVVLALADERDRDRATAAAARDRVALRQLVVDGAAPPLVFSWKAGSSVNQPWPEKVSDTLGLNSTAG